MPSVRNPSGNYRFVPGIAPYSGGVRAEPGFEIIHVTLVEPIPWQQGFERIDQIVEQHEQPAASLCSVALRCDQPHSFDGFDHFNDEYRSALTDRGLLLDGANPIARTNVAPLPSLGAGTWLYSFGFTHPAAEPGPAGGPASFVIAGAGDLVDQSDLSPEAIVRSGDRWVDAGAERASVVLDEMESRLGSLDVGWVDASQVNVYTAQPLHHVVADPILARTSAAAVHGLHWYFSHPPIDGLTFEMDLRGGTREVRTA